MFHKSSFYSGGKVALEEHPAALPTPPAIPLVVIPEPLPAPTPPPAPEPVLEPPQAPPVPPQETPKEEPPVTDEPPSAPAPELPKEQHVASLEEEDISSTLRNPFMDWGTA